MQTNQEKIKPIRIILFVFFYFTILTSRFQHKNISFPNIRDKRRCRLYDENNLYEFFMNLYL